MLKLVYASLKAKRPRKRGEVSVGEKLAIGANGRRMKVQTLDAGSRSFGDDLQKVFEKNVSRARRDNKRLLGYADLAPRKS